MHRPLTVGDQARQRDVHLQVLCLENNTGLNTWLAITPHGANGTDFAFKGWRTQPETASYGAQVITHQVTDNTNLDPCRRIFGTYRDYVPSIGLLDGYITEHSGNVLNHGRRRYLENNTGLNTWLAITPHGANGTDFAFKGWRTQPETAGYGAQVITHQVTDNTNLVPVVYDVTDVSFTNTYNSAQTLAEKFLNAGVYTADSKVLMGLHENDGYVTGNPKPQYVPVEKPWLYGGRFTDVLKQGTTSNYCEESYNCFGTYLPASTPQVRRTTQSSNARIAQLDSANLGISNSPKVDITIQNLMYVGQQIILPDEVTSSIVKMAVNGDIS